ncbi:MAG: hypothetical protein O2780_18270 [Proteobacteria bacterium]|nr:hypothetical protein [Pseudomonadota bacterium]MDA1300895.1 hypothetical protein [Pseudomonadota bacterium]
MLDWLLQTGERYADVFLGLTLFSIVSVVVVATIGAKVLARLPSDYFVNEERRAGEQYLKYFHPLLRPIVPVVKNLFGVVLIVGGFIMLFVPGQGLLTMLAGTVLTDFPGKYHCERWLLHRPQVRAAMNWLRHRAGAPEFELD